MPPNPLYAFLLLLSSAVAAVAVAIVWPRRRAPGATPLLALMLAVIVWSLTYAAHWMAIRPQARIAWLDATYLGVVAVPAAFLCFALEYTDRGHWLTRRALLLLAVEPAITLALLVTDPLHGLFFAGRRMAAASTILDGGVWFWAHVVYSYSLLLIAFILLVQAFVVRSRGPYRWQAGMILLGAILPWIGNVMELVGLSLLPGLDLTPIAFTLTGLIYTGGLLGARLLDLVPVAREALIEHMRDGVLVLDAQDRVVDINPATQKLLGVPAGQAVGQDVGALLARWPEVIERFRDVNEAQAEIELDGRSLEVQLTPLQDSQGQLSGRLVMWRDITQRKQADRERERLIAELDAYAHTVAHDLMNPVSILIGYSELLRGADPSPSEEEQELYIQRIAQTSQKLATMIEGLLLLSSVRRMEDVPCVPLDMSAIVEEATGRLAALIEESGAEIARPPAWPEALGYAPWVEQVWVNYLSNALKYGGRPPRVTLGADPARDGIICFWVRDQGPGLSPEEQARLFRPSSRIDRLRPEGEGHGLGLSIVQRIVERLGGEVSVESEVGKGSTFTFTLRAA